MRRATKPRAIQIDLCQIAGVKIWVTSHGRVYDPANPRDRRSLHEDAVDSEYESAKTSELLRRTMLANAKAGRVHGKNLYGYRRLRRYDAAKRKEVLDSIIVDPVQGPVVREAVAMLLDGKTYYQVAKHFNMKGYPPRRQHYREHNEGKGWTAVAIKQMAKHRPTEDCSNIRETGCAPTTRRRRGHG